MRKPIYKPRKGMKFIRYGGLRPVKQKNRKAPESRGLWAFVFPYFDWWFLSNPCSHGHGRFKKNGSFNKKLLKKFFYEGSIYTPISVPGGEVVETRSGHVWVKTTTKEFFSFIPKVYASDISTARKVIYEDGRRPSKDEAREYEKLVTRNPYSYVSVDHYEVFIPGKVN